MNLVYKYGLAAPHENYDRILDQMRCAQRYRNTLIEIERGRRAAERFMLATLAPNLQFLMNEAQKAEDTIEACTKAIRKERSKTRKRAVPEAYKLALESARDWKRKASDAVRQARRELRESPAIIAERDRISELALELGRNARSYSGLARRGPHFGAWGTYQLVEDAAQKSFSDLPLFDEDDVTPLDPSFVRFTGEGAVSVQIQKGVLAKNVMVARVPETLDKAATSTDSTGARIGPSDPTCTSTPHPQLQVMPPDERAWLKMPGNGYCDRKRFARHGELTLCLGTDEEGNRLYGRWRLDMHRPLPEGAIIKRATVHRRQSGPHYNWYVTFVLECPDRAATTPTIGGEIAIDIGWRTIDGELRIAGWVDTRGGAGDHRLDMKTIRALREPEEIQSRRSLLFDLQILRLSQRLGAFAEIPEGLRKTTVALRQWKSPGRLVHLRNVWRDNRFEGDVCAFDDLDAWVMADRHYWEQEARRRDAALRRRREQYRIIAKRLIETYDTIVIEQFDLRVFAKRGPVDAGSENETARSNRHLAALSELRNCIIDAARMNGRTVIAMPAHDTTRACPVCGIVADRDAAASITLTCTCGATWDQDVAGASQLLLDRWRERPGDAEILAGARITKKVKKNEVEGETRRDRVTRKRKEKKSRMGITRESTSNSAE